MIMNKQRGFTLLEVMFALTLFALIATGLLNAVTAQVRSSQQLLERSLSRWVAENQVQQLMLMSAPELGDYQFDVINFDREWSVVWRIEAVQSETYQAQLRRATIRVLEVDTERPLDELVVLLPVVQ
jgi:general secretion pathway protein I